MDNVKDLLAKIESGELSYEEKLASLAMVEDSLVQMRQKAKEQAIGSSVEYILESFNIIKAKMEKRLAEMVPKKGDKGDKGQDGKNGRDGKDGRPGRDGGQGSKGTDGLPGRDGRDGEDGVSVTDASIDFDGSLIITLSSGRVINVGEVVATDLAEKIKLVTSGGGTSQQVLDTLASLQTQINNLIPSQTGNSGKFLTTNGTSTSWATVSGGGGSGDVVGPASATNNNIVLFDGTTGKLIKQSSALTFDGINTFQLIATGNAVANLEGSSTNNAVLRLRNTTTGALAGIFANNSKQLVFEANGAVEQMRLTSTGLGIGTSSPAVKFVVSNAGANGYEFDPPNGFISSYNRSTNAWTAVTFRAGSYTWNINNSNDALKLDASGNLFTANGKIGPNATQQHTMPAVTSDTYTLNAATQTLTNKRIDPRVSTAASTATLSPDVSAFDQYNLTAQAAALTVAAPTGTPVDGSKLIIRILDNGTARAITWNATYTVIGVTLPTTTTASKTTYVGCVYNATATRWDVIAVTTQA
jgi:hypothetical protein